MDVAKLIILFATPPWVRKLPARMKNGIAMISNFSMPVKSFMATASVGTSEKKKRKVSTVRPSAMEIGIPVSIKAKRSAKTMPVLPRVAIEPSITAMARSQVAAFFLENCSQPATAVLISHPPLPYG